MSKISVVALLALAALLSACEFAEKAVIPSVTGQPATAQPAPAAAPATAPQSAATAPGQPGAPGTGIASGRPFVVIRFDHPGVAYEQQLYEAVNAALARSPGVAFDLVAVAPASGTAEEIARNSDAARADTQQVMRSLLNMGLPGERVSVTEMTDPEIQGNEARLYVR